MRFSLRARSSHQAACACAASSRPPKRAVAGLVVADPDAGEVLADAGPAVVEQYGATLVEGRRDLAGPVRAELGLDELHELGVEVVARSSATPASAQPELAEQVTGRGGEHAVVAGDRLGDLVERGGVDHRALATTGRRHA